MSSAAVVQASQANAVTVQKAGETQAANENLADDMTQEESDGTPEPIEEEEDNNHKAASRSASKEEEEAKPLTEEAIDDVARGLVYACLAITDDKELTLKKVSKTNPWQGQAVKLITGSSSEANKPLSDILKESMNLDLDCIIDISGMTTGGHFLDTQGYIAHNDEVIVLSYRCTTSAFDWLTNFSTTSSEWEIEEDLVQGYSGFCSGFENLCTGSHDAKPRVHTGFYNNFLASLPLLRRHIDPLLAETESPRKLFVTGHSLGAGIATLAACYFLLEHDWSMIPHSFVNVTAGSPRACTKSMQEVIDERLAKFGDKAKIYRIVKGKDMVTTVPPKVFGFRHLAESVYIDDDGTVVFKDQDQFPALDTVELKEAFVESRSSATMGEDNNNDDVEEYVNDEEKESKYEKFVSKVPRALRDHMPDFYLKPLFNLKGIRTGRELEHPEETILEAPESEETEEAAADVISEAEDQQSQEAAPTPSSENAPKKGGMFGWFGGRSKEEAEAAKLEKAAKQEAAKKEKEVKSRAVKEGKELKLTATKEAKEAKRVAAKEAKEAKKAAAKEAKEAKKAAAKEAKEAKKAPAKEAKQPTEEKKAGVSRKEAKEAKKVAAREAKEAKKVAAKEAAEAKKVAAKEAAEAKKVAAKEAAEAKKVAAKEAADAKKAAAKEAADAKEAKRVAAKEAKEAKKVAAKEAKEAKKVAAKEAAEAKKLAAEAKRAEAEKAKEAKTKRGKKQATNAAVEETAEV